MFPPKVEILQFAKPLVVVGGGEADPQLLKLLAARGFGLVAADGGARHCAAAGLVPDAIIGDLDSLEDREGWAARTRIVELSEQQSTDFEKCLYSTRAPLTLVLGMTGLRLDHTLAALDVMGRYSQDRPIVLIADTDIALALSQDFGFEVAPGDRVSVHPLAPVKFARSKGLLYPLDGLTLAPVGRTGTSNAATVGRFTLRLAPEGPKGPYLLVLARQYLDGLLEALMADAAR